MNMFKYLFVAEAAERVMKFVEEYKAGIDPEKLKERLDDVMYDIKFCAESIIED